MKKKRRLLRWVLWSVVVVIVVAVVGILAWTQIGVMRAEPAPLAEAKANPAISITDAPEGIVLAPAEGVSDTGLVFIPGAKVDPWAYVAILQGVAAEGTTVVITRPWLNLAFFDLRGWDSFTSAAPEIQNWSIGGHSLGGVRACQLAGDAETLVLFASYCATDLSGGALAVVSLAGTEDELSTPEKIADARHLLPRDVELIEVEGASHASFGDYGPQPGDGTPTIPDVEIRAVVTEALAPVLQR